MPSINCWTFRTATAGFINGRAVLADKLIVLKTAESFGPYRLKRLAPKLVGDVRQTRVRFSDGLEIAVADFVIVE